MIPNKYVGMCIVKISNGEAIIHVDDKGRGTLKADNIQYHEGGSYSAAYDVTYEKVTFNGISVEAIYKVSGTPDAIAAFFHILNEITKAIEAGQIAKIGD